jgi:hypothetical protein
MEYLSGKAIADTILGVAASIFKYKDEIRKVNADRRDRIAEYFLAISKTIEEAASDIERSGHPSGACESLRIFAVKLPDTIMDFVPLPEAKEYGDRLMAAYNLEHVGDRASREELDKIINELRGASGIFRALGYDMRAHR